MKRWLIITLAAAVVGFGGCSKKKVSPGELPKAAFMQRTVKPRKKGEPPPLTVTLEFRLSELQKYDWKGKALRAQILVEDEPPVYSVNEIVKPVPEVTIELTLGKSVGSAKVLFNAIWGKSAGGEMTRSEAIRFPDSAELGRYVTVPGIEGRHISQVIQMCGNLRKPLPFDPDKGIDLVIVGFGDEACRLRVWAEESLTEE